MEIDAAGVWHEPKLLGGSYACHEHPCVRWSGVSIFFAADDEQWALDAGDVIDRA